MISHDLNSHGLNSHDLNSHDLNSHDLNSHDLNSHDLQVVEKMPKTTRGFSHRFSGDNLGLKPKRERSTLSTA
ncbi:MAG TPA: hypothetical protein VHO03_08260 [Ignavibacteriales bacterium]|nr:hypothetical protein [Ignavibacteriales bacterium]